MSCPPDDARGSTPPRGLVLSIAAAAASSSPPPPPATTAETPPPSPLKGLYRGFALGVLLRRQKHPNTTTTHVATENTPIIVGEKSAFPEDHADADAETPGAGVRMVPTTGAGDAVSARAGAARSGPGVGPALLAPGARATEDSPGVGSRVVDRSMGVGAGDKTPTKEDTPGIGEHPW